MLYWRIMKTVTPILISLAVLSLLAGCSTSGKEAKQAAPPTSVVQSGGTSAGNGSTQAGTAQSSANSSSTSNSATDNASTGSVSSGTSSDSATHSTSGNAATQEGSTQAGNYVVTKEVFNRTFNEVDQVIADLNKIISEEDYEAWKGYLTDDYIRTMSDPAKLAELSQSPILKRNNIVLKSLRDYFHYVVVPSRSNLRLDDLVFIDENTVEAIMVVRGQRAILYQLEKRDGKWKIGLS